MSPVTVSNMDMMKGGVGRSNAITVSDQLTRKPDVLDRLKVLAMGLHSRLGEQSPLKLIRQFLFQRIADELPGVECWGYDVTYADGVVWVDEHVCRMQRAVVELCQCAKDGESGMDDVVEQCISDYRSAFRQYIVRYRPWWKTVETSCLSFSQIWIVRALDKKMRYSLIDPDLAVHVVFCRDLLACMEAWVDSTWGQEDRQDDALLYRKFLNAFVDGISLDDKIVKPFSWRETGQNPYTRLKETLANYYYKHGAMKLKLVSFCEKPGGPHDSIVHWGQLARILLGRIDDDEDRKCFFHVVTRVVCKASGVGE